MTKKSLSKAQRSKIVTTILGIAGDVEAIYLYGSMARGEGRDDSDIDIAIMRLAPIDASLALELRTELGAALSRDIDLLDLRRTPTEMAFQAVTDGILLHGESDPAVALYENSIMSMYAALQLERREIIADIVARGSVYGS
ncbi:MAG: nucleotidyltransferase domain-containing protein [Deltaproteobacteria bacterium]|nr:nucleotidyltransferase domain-containing protein [Deltaproteobacteria bacterium]